MPEPKKRVFESSTVGVPALQMVLVHAKNEAQNAALRRKAVPVTGTPAEESVSPADREDAVRRIIEHLETID